MAELPLQSLAGRIAVVTGASGGIGAASARLLAQAGATVIVGYNSRKDRADALIAELPGRGHLAQQIVLEDVEGNRRLAALLGERFGRVDVLVNSAGFTRPVAHADLETMDEALFQKILLANVHGPFSVIRSLMPLMKASGDAVVVNLSSISGFTGSGSNMAYCAAKAALDVLTMSMARAFGPAVRFLCVSPGAVATDFVAGRGRPELEKAAQATPLKRVVEPEDVASAVLACVTHLRVATGTTIVVDGGRHL
jgi:3-oxoacyl-[acyl-carrier protein] reductase